ncbi:uncharacterized protein LOC127565640 isoform X1 [Drosophila albomicans]|uniref:Uncharacterized protein LOC127565640 isoform X1 n=1 Tax=Drosophila albomicans TaxID=7291 RepID=A0A9C6W6E5_DROAB|nr:uncharacterized protein LOC127565640 isoform X1 [Drosophila albomicans]
MNSIAVDVVWHFKLNQQQFSVASSKPKQSLKQIIVYSVCVYIKYGNTIALPQSTIAVAPKGDVFFFFEEINSNLCLMCSECCCGCCCAEPLQQLPCQDIQLMELHAEKKITITQQPMRSNSPYSELSLAVRPYSWPCENDENYNVDDYETRTPNMWRAWWLKSASE